MPRSYNGSSDVSKSTGTPVTATAFTIAGWVYSTTTVGTHYAFGIQNNANNQGWRIGFNGTGLILACTGASTQNTQSAGNAAANTWMHLGIVASSATSRALYKNGSSLATGTSSLTPGSCNEIRIGAGTDSAGAATAYWSGAIGNVGVWSAALTASEMDALAKGAPCISIRPANLVAWYPLGAPYSNGAADFMGGYPLDTVPAEYGSNPSTYLWPGSDGITTITPASVVSGQPMSLRVGGMRHGWSRVGRGW